MVEGRTTGVGLGCTFNRSDDEFNGEIKKNRT